jgi:hypothetical protein
MLSQEALETQPIQRFVATPKPMAIQKDALYKEDAGQLSKPLRQGWTCPGLMDTPTRALYQSKPLGNSAFESDAGEESMQEIHTAVVRKCRRPERDAELLRSLGHYTQPYLAGRVGCKQPNRSFAACRAVANIPPPTASRRIQD